MSFIRQTDRDVTSSLSPTNGVDRISVDITLPQDCESLHKSPHSMTVCVQA
jgi:hypothetical protein